MPIRDIVGTRHGTYRTGIPLVDIPENSLIDLWRAEVEPTDAETDEYLFVVSAPPDFDWFVWENSTAYFAEGGEFTGDVYRNGVLVDSGVTVRLGDGGIIDVQIHDIDATQPIPFEFPEGVDSAYLYTAYIDGEGEITVLPGSVLAERATAIQLEAEPAIFSMSAQDAGLAVEKRLTADPAEFNLSAQEAGFLAHRNLAAEPAEYSLVAQDAALTRHRTLQADAATFSLSGQDADFLIDIRLTADHATFSLAGQDAAFALHRILDAQPAVFQLAGQDAAMRVEIPGQARLEADPAVFQMGAQDAALRIDRALDAEHAVFALTGQDADMRRGRAMQAEPAVFVAVGQDAAFVRDYRLHADGAVYVLAAQDADGRAPGIGEFIVGNMIAARAIGSRPYRSAATQRPYRTTPVSYS